MRKFYIYLLCFTLFWINYTTYASETDNEESQIQKEVKIQKRQNNKLWYNIPIADAWVDAWADVTIIAWNSITLDWIGTDSNWTIVAYVWSNWATTQSITVSPATTTIYTLKVKDNSGNWSELDSVTVTVEVVTNQAPVAWDGSVDALWNWWTNYDLYDLISDDKTLDNMMTISIVNNPDNLVISWWISGTVAWQPGFTWNSYFEYKVCDEENACDIWKIDVIEISN